METKLSAVMTVGMEEVTRPPVEWRVEGSLLKPITGDDSDREVGKATVALVALLHDAVSKGWVEPGRVTVITHEDVLDSREYDRRVEDPLLDVGYEIDYVTLDDGGESVLVKKAFKGVARADDDEVVIIDASRDTLPTMAVAMGSASAIHWRSARDYLVEGDPLEGVRTWTRNVLIGEEARGDNVYRDRTDIMAEFEKVSAVTTFLMSLIPPLTDVGLTERAFERLKRVALSEKVPIPGPFRRDVREGIPSPAGDDVHEMVNKYVFEPLREAVLGTERKSVVPLPESVEDAVRTVRGLEEATRNVVSFKLRRGRIADAAALMNEIHGFIRLSATVVHAAVKSSDNETLKLLANLFTYLAVEQYGRFEDPYDRIKEARAKIRNALMDLNVDIEKDRSSYDPINYDLICKNLKERFDITGVPMKSMFKRSIREAYEEALKSSDDIECKILKEWFKSENYSHVIENPPIKRIRNKLMHADPVEPRMRKEDVFVTFKKVRLHLDVITSPALLTLAEAAEGTFLGGSKRGS